MRGWAALADCIQSLQSPLMAAELIASQEPLAVSETEQTVQAPETTH